MSKGINTNNARYLIMSRFDEWLNGSYGWITILLIVFIFKGITILFYYTRDKYEPEPYSRIFRAYVYGMLSVVPSLIISLIADEYLILSPLKDNCLNLL